MQVPPPPPPPPPRQNWWVVLFCFWSACSAGKLGPLFRWGHFRGGGGISAQNFSPPPPPPPLRNRRFPLEKSYKATPLPERARAWKWGLRRTGTDLTLYIGRVWLALYLAGNSVKTSVVRVNIPYPENASNFEIDDYKKKSLCGKFKAENGVSRAAHII